MNCKPSGLCRSPVNHQVRPDYPSGRFTPRGISPTLAPSLIWIYLCLNWSWSSLSPCHFLLLENPGQQASFILNLLTLVSHREILWRIIHLSRLPKCRFKKYRSWNTHLIFSRFEDVKLASLILPKWPVYKYWWRRVIIVVDTGSCNWSSWFAQN